ncbi:MULTISPECIES: DUF421 domain-containing protein [Bacillus]|uniref:YetF C-terminal domain-containing protein n=2 Tax=Bacillus TaxID=1386 RepID=A0A0M5JBS6_9BACI|nr:MULTISPECIES: DUF421 domain-containing protein [Bacillus]ALC82157.1 hypothetical protein AM592_11590 [Bacillus gobiensis]MBP1080974.1 uncharacterized membrane protein YcaP (DUF421 family) [Bacillus capparidis]MED1095675.1 DUF421 domain-containing protein [Bacillus capparidis]
MNFAWESFILIMAGIILLRISGRKSIAQMTLAQTVVMISIGTIIVQPIIEDSLWRTIIAASIFVASLIIMEYLQLKFNFFEKFLTGKSIVVVENGNLNTTNLKKLRLTVDQLEMRLRLLGISKISDVKTATLEPNGQLGYELKEEAKPLTVGEFKKLINPAYLNFQSQNQESNNNIFDEITSGHTNRNPNQLH